MGEAQKVLDARAAWPVRTVEDDGEVCGVLMPLIPDYFFRTRYLPSGEPDKALCEWQHLFVDPERNRRLGMPTPITKVRVLLCRDFASVLHLLHTNDFVVGDINAKNAVFRLTARPSVHLVDCDAIRASLYRDPNHLRGVLDARGHRMLTDALGPDAERRPAAVDWGCYLDGVLGMRPRSLPAVPKPADPQLSSTPGWVRDPKSRRWVPIESDVTT